MGLGKTAQTCSFLSVLYGSGRLTRPSVIAAPASLVDGWASELQRWAPALGGRAVVYRGKQAERRRLILDFLGGVDGGPSAPCILVTSTSTLASKWDEAFLRQLRPLGYLVVDEAHALKNRNALSYKRFNKVLQAERRLLLTGSPIQNRTEELSNLLLFLMPDVFSSTSLELAVEALASLGDANQPERRPDCKVSSSSSSGPPSSSSASSPSPSSSSSSIFDVLASSALSPSSATPPDVALLQRILAPFILRRLKTEVLADLPAKTLSVLSLSLEGRQREMYASEIRARRKDVAAGLQLVKKWLPARSHSDLLVKLSVPEGADSSSSPPGAGAGWSAAGARVSSARASPSPPRTQSREVRQLLASACPPPSPSSSSSRKFVNSVLPRLRRVCNHPLLMQGLYSPADIDELITFYHSHVPGYKEVSRDKVAGAITMWSDFEVHQAIRTLVFQGDQRMAHLLLDDARLLESAKVKKMMELVVNLKAKGEKALIFSQFTTYLDVIETCIATHAPHVKMLRLDGTTDIISRHGLVNQFNQHDDVSLFLLSTKAGGQGLNLTGARTVILMDQDWNPHNDLQAEDRVHRLGQTKPVVIYRLCCRGTIEESILKV
eukprot:GHVT01089498.1.p1 GENE.GHVT01089498.1~~GHVT01089498.1.p1  ORF type:complete len:671 (+),score=187.14 GHVT01089498.1:190-2013(+)